MESQVPMERPRLLTIERAFTAPLSLVNPVASSFPKPFPLPSPGPPPAGRHQRPRRPARGQRNAKEAPPAKSRATSPVASNRRRLSGQINARESIHGRSISPATRATPCQTYGLSYRRFARKPRPRGRSCHFLSQIVCRWWQDLSQQGGNWRPQAAPAAARVHFQVHRAARRAPRCVSALKISTPGAIRTHDLRFRKPSLYPAELREHTHPTRRQVKTLLPRVDSQCSRTTSPSKSARFEPPNSVPQPLGSRTDRGASLLRTHIRWCHAES